MLNRRLFIAAFLASVPMTAAAQTVGGEILLWPNGAPGAEKVKVKQVIGRSESGSLFATGVTRPSLVVYRPSGAFTKAVLVIPGGGFRQVVTGKEGHDIAKWLASNGIAAGVLTYRLTSDGWPQGANIMLEDSQRAIRLLRQETGAAQVGVLGFSAGGTLAADLDARAGEAAYKAVDAADRLPAQPDFVGLGYPALRTVKLTPPYAPTFIFHAEDDTRVPVSGSREAYKEITRAGGKAELHIFPTGGHGFALVSPPGSPSAVWPGLFLDWLKRL